MNKLLRNFYERDTVLVARELLGKYLIHTDGDRQRIGKIVEVEAYVGQHDLGCHASKGLTKRTSIMYGPAGHAYVYLVYGIHYCVNLVTEKVGIGSAVLIRAVEPVAHISDKTKGPGLLCKAMGIDLRLNNEDLTGNILYVAEPPVQEDFSIIAAPRIGIPYAGAWIDKPLRFYIAGSTWISRR